MGCDLRLTLLDDAVIASAAAVIVASALVMGTFLARFRQLILEADKSTRMANDLWDSVNARFSVIDTRLIDVMAKTEVLTAKSMSSSGTAKSPAPIEPRAEVAGRTPETRTTIPVHSPSAPAHISVAAFDGTQTDAMVLRLLAGGPKSSAQIKDEIGRSREHTARLMKALFDRGFVVRNDRHKPYVYEITDSGRSYVAS
jgi:biotin operon repressor